MVDLGHGSLLSGDTVPQQEASRHNSCGRPLVIGSVIAEVEGLKELEQAGARVYRGVKEAVSDIVARAKRFFESAASGS
jgi:hypothetical protein